MFNGKNVLVMEKIETFNPVNITAGKSYTIKEVLNAILTVDSYQGAKIVFNSSKPTMIPKRLIDTSKAKNILGFEAKTPLIDGIKKTVEWYRKERREKDKK